MTNLLNIRKNANYPSSHPTQTTFLTLSPHSILARTLPRSTPPTVINFDALQSVETLDKSERSKLDALQQGILDLEKEVNRKLGSKDADDLRYDKLCVHPMVDLPLGYKIPKFNMFDGHGDPVAHLKDYCSRSVDMENNEALLMRLFIQSLSGIAFTWYVKQDFDKWSTWEDMARDFVEQYKFNIKADPTMLDLLELKKMPHESFEEYVTRWRLEASKVHHLPYEEELVQTFIRSLDGIYYKTLFFTSIQSFDSLIRIGKELEYAIQTRKIADKPVSPQVLKNVLEDKNKDASTSEPQKQYNTEHVNVVFGSADMHSRPYNSQVSQHEAYPIQFDSNKDSPKVCQTQLQSCQHKERKPRTFTPLNEPLIGIFQRLWAQGLLKPRKGWIPIHTSLAFDPSKNCVYHSNIQGHDTEECQALRNKIQNLIEKGKLIVQQGLLSDNCNPITVHAVQSGPTRNFSKKRKSYQRN